MKLKYILYLIPVVLIIAANLFWGSVISWFLSIAIIASLLYYAVRLGWEDRVNALLLSFKKDDARLPKLQQVNEKWKSVMGFSLLAIVFISAVFTVIKTTRPGGHQPWFLNNEYHSISHQGIAFDKGTTIYTERENTGSRIGINGNGQMATLNFQNVLKPVMGVQEGKPQLLNKVFASPVDQGFAISNNLNRIQVSMQPAERGFFKKLLGRDANRVLYTLNLQCNDAALLAQLGIAAPFKDKITLEAPALKRGMSLFQLFLNNNTFHSNIGLSYQVLEDILLPMDDSYLLASYEGEKPSLYVVPGKGFLEGGYRLEVNGNAVAPQLNTTATLPYGEKFFVGFNNFRQQLLVDKIAGGNYGLDEGEKTALLFDFPAHYLLKSPGEQPPGSKNFRFITNDFEELTGGELTEGFYFQNYNLGFAEKVRGSMNYTSQKPGVPLSVSVSDYLKGQSTAKEIATSDFSLSTSQPGVTWLFHIRDFSDNGFATHRTLLYLSLTFLAFVVLLAFFPGKKIDRIEPIILTVIFALLTLRYLLYWRLGTFPPLENISKHELENTLLGFDFSFLGLSLPIPLSLIWTLLFVLLLIWYRRRPHNTIALMPGPKWERFFQTPLALAKSYGVFILGCLVLFYLNKSVLHIELLTRIVSILIPLLGYCYFSVAANRVFVQTPMPLRSGERRFFSELKAYVYYLFHNPVFLLTFMTLVFFALADRGFAILFALFILLKNIFVNFLKKPLDTSRTSFGRMLFKPNNYWVFGLLALVVYLAILAYKPLFYFLLQYKLLVVFAAFLGLLAIVWIAFPQAKKLRLPLLALVGLYGLLLLIPASKNAIDDKATEALKHVAYRASIIYKPLSEMLQEHPYSSFATRKIIETAENQWFINAYISKDYDPAATINLRPYSKVGVDYPTQTRDVLTARFLVGELGDFTMYLILILCILPLILYLTSYRLAPVADTDAEKAGTVAAYAGLIPLILFFTLALFVWLTSTNRFVFFGQDFPFLSLTSRLSVLLPLLLFAFTLIQHPATHLSTKINLQANVIKYAFFIALIAFFALVTVKENELNTESFNVAMETTETHIDKDLNVVLDQIQDSLQNKNKRYSYQQLIHLLGQSKAFDSLVNKQVSDPYTRSILENLIERPHMAFTLNNPLFMVYDNGRYQAVYNQNLYLQLPVIESRDVWNGKVLENIAGNQNSGSLPVYLKWKGAGQYVTPPYYAEDPSTGVQLGIVPAGWIAGADEPTGILAGAASGGKERFVYQNQTKIMKPVALKYAQTLHYDDVALAQSGKSDNRISFQAQGRSFAFNKWVNGRYKIIYPLGADNFWLYHFATGVRANYSNDSSLVRNETISLDYELTHSVSNLLATQSQPLADKQRNYGFSVMTADGDGNIRLMQDVVGNRQRLDPNDENKIYQLQQQHFFFSNARNERDQWGNRNLIHLYLGPGSAIKPLFAAVIASGVNAGWESLQLNPPPAVVTDYAGLKLQRPWKYGHEPGGIMDMATYIAQSSNFYQGLMMFVGSYTRNDFGEQNPSFGKLLTTAATGYPVLQWQGRRYYLPAYNSRKGNWPVTDASAKRRSFFGNERSLIAVGFEGNSGLATTDGFADPDQPNFVHSRLYQQWRRTNAGYLWAFPESSLFLQKNRDYAGIQENFNVGLKTTTLGGYPYQLTPFKMLEMYMGLAGYNRDYHLRVNGKPTPATPWQKDASWGAGAFEGFLARQIFTGMARVITGGTGTAIRGVTGKRPDLYFYAKTGTINEESSGRKSSRRFIVMASDKDLTKAENIGKARTYGWFFAVDNTGNFDWNLLIQIMEQTMNAASFNNYFKPQAAAPTL